MNTFLSRANGLTAYTMTWLAALAFICFLTTFLEHPHPEADVTFTSVHLQPIREHPQNPTATDYAFLKFDMYADVSSLFNWNVQMLFLYVTAEYETRQHKVNQVVLWDRIVMRERSNHIISVKDMKTKYDFFDATYGGLKGNNVTLSLHYNVIPLAGLLPRSSIGHRSFIFPVSYGTNHVYDY
eukprot:Colp12_sorted_trinity150504_noHs@18887